MGTHIIAAVTTYWPPEYESPLLSWLFSLIFSNKAQLLLSGYTNLNK